jgi:L-asparaginase
MALLVKAINNGLHSKCNPMFGGSVNGSYETSTGLKAIGVISEDITTEAAITKLMYLLSQNNKKRL